MVQSEAAFGQLGRGGGWSSLDSKEGESTYPPGVSSRGCTGDRCRVPLEYSGYRPPTGCERSGI